MAESDAEQGGDHDEATTADKDATTADKEVTTADKDVTTADKEVTTVNGDESQLEILSKDSKNVFISGFR